MKLKSIKWGLVLSGGWVVILTTAGVVLPSDSKLSTKIAIPLIGIMAVWFFLSVIGLWVYFYRGWQRLALAENKPAYIVWMSLEMACALAVVGAIIWFFTLPNSH